jgi:hypothetical protein
MIYKCVLVLQFCMELVKVVPGSNRETCHDGNDISIKDEDVTDIEEDEDPLLITSPLIKSEQEVCMPLCTAFVKFCLYANCMFSDLSLSVHPPMHVKQDPSVDWI